MPGDPVLTAEGQADDGWAPEVAEWMAQTSRCVNCGDRLVRNPAVIGSWLAEGDGLVRGVCPANPVQYAGGAPHVAGEVILR